MKKPREDILKQQREMKTPKDDAAVKTSLSGSSAAKKTNPGNPKQQQHEKKKKATPSPAKSTATTAGPGINPVKSEIESAKADLKPAVNSFLKTLKSGVKSSVGAAVKVGKLQQRPCNIGRICMEVPV